MFSVLGVSYCLVSREGTMVTYGGMSLKPLTVGTVCFIAIASCHVASS